MKTRRRAPVVHEPAPLPEPGARVGVECGPGEFAAHNAGIVLCHVAQEWMPGEFRGYALVLMDSGQVKECSGLNRGPGIGWHLVA
jgi:hypothetical protein